MDDFKDFLNLSKPFAHLVLPTGVNNGRVLPCENFVKKTVTRPHLGTDYVEEFLAYESDNSFQTNANIVAEFTDDEVDTSPDPVYTKYSFRQCFENADLPIFHLRNDILKMLEENQVVVVEGGTGCGKSTQVPQFILDNGLQKNQRVNIMVTQPRRIGARSLAERVCRERKWELGSVVGYQIALDNVHSSEDTRIMYCTTGVLLERLIKTRSLADFTHIILDEVHERGKDMDFLFIIIRKLLSSQRAKTKIVLMSATIEAEKFAKYFEMPLGNAMVPAPIIQVKKDSCFTVKNFFLDDLERLNKDPKIDYNVPSISDDVYQMALRIILVLKKFPGDVITNGGKEMLATVLVFLPGIHEIMKMHSVLTDYMNTNPKANDWSIIVLHSSIGADQQFDIFRNVGANTRKIILSTNIAESSITVPDVVYVIDFCLSKYLVSNSATNFTSLQLCWASKSNMCQRSGRAGRVRDGRCYRLIHRDYYNRFVEESAVPEMIRTPLENIVLKTKMLNMGPPHALLALAMDKPKLSDIANTILILKEMGALLRTTNGELTDFDGDITFIGRVMCDLPLDVRVSKLIILGYCFSLLDDCIIIGAGLSIQNVFVNSFKQNMFPYSCKLEWSNGSGSDLIALLNVYKVWSQKYNQREFSSDADRKIAEQQFGRRHAVDIRSMTEFNLLVAELTRRLNNLNIKEQVASERVIWKQHERSLVLKVIIAGAFYPNFFLRTSIDDNQYEHMAYHSLNGRDPRTTVFYTGFQQKCIRNLYSSSIMELLIGHAIDESARSDVKVLFDRDTEKVFITFLNKQYGDGEREDWMTHRPSIPGGIATEVYKAVKMRLSRMPTTIRVIGKSRDEMLEAQKHGLGFVEGSVFIPKPKPIRDNGKLCIPRSLDKQIAGIITHIESPERFWFQPKSEQEQIECWNDELNPIELSDIIQQIPSVNDIKIGDLIAAPRNGVYHRAKVTAIKKEETEGLLIRVDFIDSGLTGECLFNDVYSFERETSAATLPPRCFQSCLANVRPSAMQTYTNDWTAKSIRMFRELTSDKGTPRECVIEPYSCVNGVARVNLLVGNKNINKELMKSGCAEHAEENYMSKQNHAFRLSQQYRCYDGDTTGLQDDGISGLAYIDEGDDAPPPLPPRHLCNREVRLRGPFSPLERKIYSVTSSGQSKVVSVDPQSVNSVLLENNPQDSFHKFVVAAAIHETNGIDSHLVARETTLMPNIPGFGALMALIFAPRVELMRDADKSRYISILSGLGYNPGKKVPLFNEHDCVIPLDVAFTMDDMTKVNQLRYCLDSLLYTAPGDQLSDNVSKTNKNALTLKIRDVLMQLLRTERKFVELHTVDHTWNQFHSKDLKVPEVVYADRAIFPMHPILQLEPPSEREADRLRAHCAELHDLVRIDAPQARPIRCQLCAQDFNNTPQLRLHMYSRLHLNREEQINYVSQQ